jgi:DNA-binding Lrp family transcriptional regulator
MHRVNKLEQSGIIKKYTVQLDYQKLGYELVVCIDIRVAKGKLFEVERLVAKHPSVQAVYDVTGSFDSLVIAKFKNRKELDNFVKKIQTYDFVERTETRLVLNTIKEEFIEV